MGVNPFDEPGVTQSKEYTKALLAQYVRAGALTPDRVGLDVLVEEFIGVEFRTVAVQEEQPHLVPMAPHPALHPRCHMYGMLVDDQKDRAPRMANQAPLTSSCRGAGDVMAVR